MPLRARLYLYLYYISRLYPTIHYPSPPRISVQRKILKF